MGNKKGLGNTMLDEAVEKIDEVIRLAIQDKGYDTYESYDIRTTLIKEALELVKKDIYANMPDGSGQSLLKPDYWSVINPGGGCRGAVYCPKCNIIISDSICACMGKKCPKCNKFTGLDVPQKLDGDIEQYHQSGDSIKLISITKYKDGVYCESKQIEERLGDTNE